MAGHGRSKNGIASLAYAPAIHAANSIAAEERWMAGVNPGTTNKKCHATNNVISCSAVRSVNCGSAN
jgi:hypothetical protein